MVSEISQPYIDYEVDRFHLNEVPKVVKFTDRVECWLSRAGRRGNGELLFNGYNDFQFCKMRKFYRRITQQCVTVNTTGNCTFKNC